MAPTTIAQLGLVAQTLLDQTVLILETTSGGVPGSQYLAVAQPAFDCEFVAVQTQFLQDDVTSPLAALDTKKRNKFGELITATFTIYVVRCAPQLQRDGGPPSDTAKTENSLMILEDGWALWNGFRAIQDDVFDGCLGAYFDSGVPVSESGGFIGWVFTMRANIEGYLPV